MQRSLYFTCGVSTLFAWGLYGLNMLRHWPKVAGAPAYSLSPIRLEQLLGMDQLTTHELAQKLIDSERMRLQVAARHDATGDEPHAEYDGTVLHSLGNHFTGSMLPRVGGPTGRVTCALINIEDTVLPDAADICRDYHLMITPSGWNERLLRERGVSNVATVIQGVDTSVFHPAPRSGALDGRFAVFSGGKLEHRKAQDLVLLAFRAFAQRHKDALLVTSWHSPWPAVAQTLNANPHLAPVGLTPDGKVDVSGWAAANGLREDQFIALDLMPNPFLGAMLREMDVAVFPNRCEGGTNLVAMECMACGVPSIVSSNTGHMELVATGGTLPLRRQRPLPKPSAHTEGWGESDVDEIIGALEQVWADRDAARQRGEQGARAMATWNWRKQIAHLAEVLAPL